MKEAGADPFTVKLQDADGNTLQEVDVDDSTETIEIPEDAKYASFDKKENGLVDIYRCRTTSLSFQLPGWSFQPTSCVLWSDLRITAASEAQAHALFLQTIRAQTPSQIPAGVEVLSLVLVDAPSVNGFSGLGAARLRFLDNDPNDLASFSVVVDGQTLVDSNSSRILRDSNGVLATGCAMLNTLPASPFSVVITTVDQNGTPTQATYSNLK
ncbi:MAG: hypothetical protein RL885_13065 [Planctomycetota bacterium]